MTENYRFKAAYVIDITSKIGRIKESFDKWNIPYEEDEDGGIKCLGEWNCLKGDDENGRRKAVLQFVVSEYDVEDKKQHGFTFRPELVAEIMQGIHEKQDESFLKFMFDMGYGRFYPVAYTWNTDEKEPIVLQ